MDAAFNLPKLDEAGYLVEPDEWNENFAEYIARRENIRLTEAHWEVIHLMRSYYEAHHEAPDVRFLIKHISRRLGDDAQNELFNTFIYGYVWQACKLAGMKRPHVWDGSPPQAGQTH